MFFIFCAVRASHLRHIAALRTLAANAAQVEAKASLKPKPVRPPFMPPPNSEIVSLTRDLRGNMWVGTEDDGVFRCNPEAAPDSQWSQFTTTNGLGDNDAYSIACDQQGRIWVGELNHGVAVFNGEHWKNYDIFDGPIGERIFRIAVCPTDGDVWMATSAGLTRYSPKADAWRNYTRADGLPSDQANGLAFDAKGNLFVGTQCDGIAIGSAADGYKQWRVIPGPDHLPGTSFGSGLPGGLINDLLVTRDQKIYAATTAGLAVSTNSGNDWQFIRGEEYAAKFRELIGDRLPKDWQAPTNENSGTLLLPEDYITCLAEDKHTNLWLGFRAQGYAVLNSKADKMLFHDSWKGGWLHENYVTAILPGEDFRGYVGTYGGGLTMPDPSTNNPEQGKVHTNVKRILAVFPSPAKPPTADELAAMLDTVQNLPFNQTNALCSDQTNAVYLGQDWKTQGDWTGRYGRQHAVLSAMAAPLDHYAGWGWHINISPHMGPHHDGGDSLRYWAGGDWLTTTDPRALYSPVIGNRRVTEWDDHGESYSPTYQGPDIWVQVGVPEGVFRLAFYFVNYNGHHGSTETRDYLLELKSYTNVPAEWENQPTLARSRVQKFWGGEYQCFIVTGPAQYHLRIGRNYSFNTMCEGVFVDRLMGPGFPPADDSWLPWMEHVWYKPPAVPPVDAKGEPPDLLGARDLWTALDDAITMKQGVEMQNEYRLLAYRAALTEHAPEPLLANWRWKMPWWTADDRTNFWGTVQKAYLGRTGQLPPIKK